MGIGAWLPTIIFFLFLVFGTLIFLASRYKRCPSDQILVIYGKVGEGQSADCIHGGGTLVWPLIQDYAYMDLTPMTISIPLQNALSQQNIRINVPSTFTVGISTEEGIMNNAAERLLNLPQKEIEEMAKEIIFGQLRLTVASLTIEQINQDREKFLEEIRKNVAPELNKIGLYLINVNITDITDESDYIESIGKKASSEAINQAKVDVAEQEKKGAIGQAEAAKEKDIRVAENVAESEKGQKKADAYMRGEVANREALEEIQKAQYKTEHERLRAEDVVQKEIEKQKIEIAAEAEAEKTRREAKGQADAILLKYEAEAEGIKKVLESKASGCSELVQSCSGDAKSAGTFLMIEKLEDLVSMQVEAVKNLKIDKITVWDSGKDGGSGTTTANFLSGFVKSLPPLHDIAEMAGLDLPKYLGDMTAIKEPADNNTAEKKEAAIKKEED